MTTTETSEAAGSRPERSKIEAHEWGEEAVRHLQALVRIDTTNPPGNETPAAEYLAGLLERAGIEPTLVGATPDRKNVIARLKGDGSKAPLLLHAHLDVVPAEPDKWTHPPFGGVIDGGYLWGRGTIDVKHMAVMSALALVRLAREGVRLARDVIFAGVADEEGGCDQGSRWLVENHPDLVRAEFALGEVGAFTVRLNGAVLYPIAIAERGTVWMKLRMHGPPGHGTLPRTDNVLGRLGRALDKLARTRLPVHRLPLVQKYLDTLAATQKFPTSFALRNLYNKTIGDFILRTHPDRGQASALWAQLSNTAVPTVIRGGTKTNVIPGSAEVELDGRTLPSQTAADLVAEIKKVVEDDCEIEIVRDMPPLETDPDTELMELCKQAIVRNHPGAVPVPYLMPGFTDAKQWSRLGARCYGFMPIQFPDDGVKFADLFHGHDERIPVAGLRWGTQVLYEVVKAFVTA